MSTRTRRGFIAAVAAAAGGAVALPLLASGQASATAEASPLVTRPDHPNAEYPAGADAEGDIEPLNACAPCGLDGRGA